MYPVTTVAHPEASRTQGVLLALVVVLAAGFLGVLSILVIQQQSASDFIHQQCLSRVANIQRSNVFYDNLSAAVSRSGSLDAQTKNSIVSAIQDYKLQVPSCEG